MMHRATFWAMVPSNIMIGSSFSDEMVEKKLFAANPNLLVINMLCVEQS